MKNEELIIENGNNEYWIKLPFGVAIQYMGTYAR
jgi:hypothetical protein